jgi:hypothetical protein
MTLPSDDSDISRCQVCGRPAQVHLTDVRGKHKNQKHLCIQHAEAAGLPIGTAADFEAAVDRMAADLRLKQSFIRRHGRLPVAGEQESEVDAASDSPNMEITDPALLKVLEELDRTASFLEKHRQIPATPDDLQSHECPDQRESSSTLNYSTPAPPDRLSKLRRTIHMGVLADVCLATIFAITRPIQLRQPDPFNNVWTLISTFALLGGVALWAILVVAGLILLRHGRKLSVIAYLWLTVAGIVVANGVIHALLFLWKV